MYIGGKKLFGLFESRFDIVGEIVSWLVYHDGRVTPCSTEQVAESNASYYRERGSQDVRIEKQARPIVVETLI